MYNTELYEVNIQTLNTCNRKCEYCSVNYPPPPRVEMDVSLFQKILNDLKDINFNGIISIYDGNEPLLDKRLPELTRMVSEYIPEAKSFISTNGDFLTQETADDLYLAGLNRIFVSLHDLSKLDEMTYYSRIYGYDRFSIIKMFNLDKVFLHNNAGVIKNDSVSQIRYLERGCVLPFRQLVISSSGDVNLCCNDLRDEMIIQNARVRSVVDIFYNHPVFKHYRERLSQNTRKGLKYCEECSNIGYHDKIRL